MRVEPVSHSHFVHMWVSAAPQCAYTVSVFRFVLQDQENKRVKELSEEELVIIRGEVDKYQIEGDLVSPSSLSPTRRDAYPLHPNALNSMFS